MELKLATHRSACVLDLGYLYVSMNELVHVLEMSYWRWMGLRSESLMFSLGEVMSEKVLLKGVELNRG